MRRLLFICVIMLVPMFCFAQGEYGDIELFTGMPFFYGGLDAGNGREDAVKTDIPFSLGIGAANYNSFGNNNFGIVFIGNFIFPQALAHTANGRTNRYGRKDELTVLDFQLGLGYHLLGMEAALRIPVTFGLHFLYLSGVLESSPTEMQNFNSFSLGFASSVAVEMHINLSIYFFARIQTFLDFITLAKHTKYTGVNVGGRMAYFIESKDYGVLSAYFGIAPAIGVGIKIDGLIGNNKKR